MAFGIEKSGIELGYIAKSSLGLLVRSGIIEPGEAINIEVQILAKYSILADRKNVVARIISQIRPACLKEMYDSHLKCRRLNRTYKFPSVNVKPYSFECEIEPTTENALALPCSRCNYLYAELRVSWVTDEVRMLEVPKYNICCSMCGYSNELKQSERPIEILDLTK